MAERSSPTRGGPQLPTDLASAAPDQVVNIIHKPLLQAAVLRGLRLCGRLDRIEAEGGELPHCFAVGAAGICRRGPLCTLPNFRMRSYSVKLRSVYAVQDWELGRRTLWMRAGDGFWR